MRDADGVSERLSEIVEVDPFRCRMWRLHDRLDDYLTEESCKAEIESFRRHGQLVPALARRLQNDPQHDLELIYGARRLFIARHLNRKLAVHVRDIDDRNALVAMDVENRHRKDISPYERGLSYARWLRSRQFSSQEEIARALQISASQVSRLLKLARLPSGVINAFRSPLDICEGWGLELAGCWEDPARRHALIRRAREIAERTPRPGGEEVFQMLISAGGKTRLKLQAKREEVVLGENREPLFRLRRLRRNIVLALPVCNITPASLENIKRSVAAILQQPRSLTRSSASRPDEFSFVHPPEGQ